MAHKTSVISQFLDQHSLARDHGVFDIHNHADAAILNISTVVFVVGRVLASDLAGDSIDHPSQRLRDTTIT